MGDSPVKKINFEGKENAPIDAEIPVPVAIKILTPIIQEVKEEKSVIVAPTIKASESDEPLLQENPQRFVLFPIKYHEVGLPPLPSTRHA